MAYLYAILAVAGWVWTLLVLMYVGWRWSRGRSARRDADTIHRFEIVPNEGKGKAIP
jgi:hypothetical protein